MSKLTPRGVERASCVDPAHLVIAVGAILARMRKIALAVPGSTGPRRHELVEGFTEAGEAAENLLAVVVADGRLSGQARQLRERLDVELTSARSFGAEVEAKNT